jgi:hypothetical protein
VQPDVTITIGAALADCSVWMSWVGRRSPRLEPWSRTSTDSSRRRSPALGASTAVPTTLMASCEESAWRTSARPAHEPEMKIRMVSLTGQLPPG